MKIRKPMTMIVFFLILIAGSAGWFIFLFAVWGVLRLLGLQQDLWSMVASLSTAVTAAAILSAGFVAHQEIQSANKSRYLAVMENLFQDLNAREQIMARKWIYRNLQDFEGEATLAALDEEGKYQVKIVLNEIDKIAFLTQSGFIPLDEIMRWINPMVVKSWQVLAPLVQLQRELRGEPDYYRDAEVLAQACITWRREHYPGEQYRFIENEKVV
ncbi:MAG: hypothetical protein HPY85_10290 [Anaerolineae bacterium]|nr:hypothetical protein [Anaerolineae bacterium]